MKKPLVCVLVLVNMMMLGNIVAHAQDRNSKIDVFAGYSFMTSGPGDYYQNMNGYAVDATYNFSRHFGMEANLNGANGTLNLTVPGTGETRRQNQDEYYFLFGPKVQTNVGKVQLFSHFLVGAARLRFSDQSISGVYTIDTGRATPFSAGIGGGADWNFGSGRYGLRILELDYLFSRNPGFDSGQLNNLRLETGLVVRF